MLKRFRGPRAFHAHETSRFDSLNGLPLASFKRRAWAYVIDVCLVYFLGSLLDSDFSLFHRADFSACGMTFGTVMMALMKEWKELAESLVYFAVALKLGKGQTPGKWLMKVRVVSLTHHGMSWWQSIERALGYGASYLEGGFGFFQYYLNQNRMCVHDRIAETIVIDLRKPRIEPPVNTDVAEMAYEQRENLAG